MKSKLATAIALVGLMHSSVLYALGLGDIKVSSAVNERLNAEIPLVHADGLDASQILVSLASKADFARAEVERNYFLSSLEFTVERGESGTPVLRLQTPDVVLEPYLNFLVELRWPKGRLLREYTVLLDLPNYSAAPARIVKPVVVSAPPVTPPPNRTKTKPVVRSSMPAKPSATPAANTPSSNNNLAAEAGSAVTVRANDTLWRIAKRVREEGASINQTMLALQATNPNAFINNNINLLKKGAVLRLPVGMSANRVSEQEAQQSVAEQQLDWQSGQSNSNTDLNPVLDARESTQSSAAQPEATEGHLQLAAVDDTASVNALINNDSDTRSLAGNALDQGVSVEINRLRNELAISLENLDRAAVENTTMDTRLAAMESQLGDLEQLVSLKDQELASMRMAIEERKAALEAAATDSAQDDATPKTNANTPVAEVGPLEALANTLSISVEWLVGIGVAFVAALIAIFMWFFARRDDAYEATVFERVEPLADEDIDTSLDEDEAEEESYDMAVDESADADADGYDLDSRDLDESIITEVSESEAAELENDFDGNVSATDKATEDFDAERDVIAEADIYLAYGRYEQAREMLDNAIEAEPTRIDLQLKRLELFVAQQSPDLFRNACQALLSVDPTVNVAAEALLKEVENIADWWPEDTVATPTDDGCRATPDDLELKTIKNKLKIQNIKTLSDKA